MKFLPAFIFINFSFGCPEPSLPADHGFVIEPATTSVPSPTNSQSYACPVDSPAPLPPLQSADVDFENRQPGDILIKKMVGFPAELKAFDFENFSYSVEGKKLFTLHNGEFENPHDTKTCDKHFGGLRDLYHDYLEGEKIKQALVITTYVSCGGVSCNGGASNLFIYQMRHHRPHLTLHLATGGRVYGGWLRSIVFKNGELVTEQIGSLFG